MIPLVAKVVVGAADVLLAFAADGGDEDDDIDEGSDWAKTEAGGCGGGFGDAFPGSS